MKCSESPSITVIRMRVMCLTPSTWKDRNGEARSRQRHAVLRLSRSGVSERSKSLEYWRASRLLSPLSCRLSFIFCWAVNRLLYLWTRSLCDGIRPGYVTVSHLDLHAGGGHYSLFITSKAVYTRQIYGATAIKSGRLIAWKAIMTVEAAGLGGSGRWSETRNLVCLALMSGTCQKGA